MAKRPSVKEILEAARKAGAASAEAPAATAETEVDTGTEPEAVEASPAPAVAAPTAESLGRPLTLAEKLAAARSATKAPPAASAPVKAKPAAAPAGGEEKAKTVPPPPPPVGRPLTLAEKLAQARGAAAASPAVGAGAAKPAAAKPAAAPKPAAAKRELPPLDKITDPKDLAEALRQTGVKKTKEVEAAKVKTETGKPAKEKEIRPSTVLPRPTKAGAIHAAQVTRRAVFSTLGLIVVGWAAFVLGVSQFTGMLGRFMFPNVLAEPPSTVKVGPSKNFEPEQVNERFKTEWGFWVVRSTRYNGQDIIYALSTICTHLGCPPNWLDGEQKFKCPCHGSGFYVSGINFEGPAPRPLERFKIVLADDGQLVVDKSQKFQEELGQWSDPDSFISA